MFYLGAFVYSLTPFFSAKNYYLNFFQLKYFKLFFLFKKILNLPIKNYYKKKNLSIKFKKVLFLNLSQLTSQKQFFFGNWFFNRKSNLEFTNIFFKNKLIILALNYLLIDRFNQVFFINLYTAPNMFKNEKVRYDLLRNMFLVKK